jgi:HPt (histidine-containing phosphotransfer) domain-containing protein
MGKEKIVVYADPDFADNIPWYLGQVKEYTDAIAAAMEKADFETVRTAGHRMKGSGASFGFDPISQMGKSLEQAAKEKNIDQTQKIAKELSEYIDLVEVVYEKA